MVKGEHGIGGEKSRSTVKGGRLHQVGSATQARLECMEQKHRQYYVEERRVKASNEQKRQAERKALCEQVGLARSASAGRVAASRAQLLEEKRQLRGAEAPLQRHALAEKERRLRAAREEHARVVAAKFRQVDGNRVVHWLHMQQRLDP